jgi:hypothetical protein
VNSGTKIDSCACAIAGATKLRRGGQRQHQFGSFFHHILPFHFPRIGLNRGTATRELLLPDLPQARQPVRFDDQEEDDQRAGDHEGEMFDRRRADRQAEKVGQRAQDDRQNMDKRRAHEGADERAQAADDDHEQQQEALVDVEGLGLGRAEPQEHHHRAGDAGVERRHGEGEELGVEQADAHQLRGDVHVAHRHPHAADAAMHEIGGEPTS